MSWRIFSSIVLMIIVLVTVSMGQDVPPSGDIDISDIKSSVEIPVFTSLANISSTSSGGPWSSPTTWAGGVVPGGSDAVTIAAGATVTIDTDSASAGSVTIGSGGSPATLKFSESGASALTVSQNVVVSGADDLFVTGGGNGNQHVLSVGGNLINNGTLDFSTSNSSACAGIVFTGASSNTFGGTGAVTDICTLTINKGTSAANILELNAANFTVQGSSTDGPPSGYLFLTKGTFKISGTFTGAHRTFVSAAYQISAGAGFWLNNPNYTITPQANGVHNLGYFRLSAGAFSVGTGTGHSFNVLPDSFTIIEGGAMTVAGGYEGYGRFNYNQSGGTLTTCTWGPAPGGVEGCFKTSFDTQGPASFSMTGGELVIQNPPAAGLAYDHYRAINNSNMTGGTVRFGNSQSAGPGTFRFSGSMPDFVIDTTAGAHTARFVVIGFSSNMAIRNINIGPGGRLDASNINLRLTLNGDTFINNGTWNTEGSSESTYFCENNTQDLLYTGTGTHTGIINQVYINCNRFTLSPTVGNLRVRNMSIWGDVVNTNKLTLGGSGAFGAYNYTTWFGPNAGTFDSAPAFDLRYGGQELAYAASRTIGLEINPERKLARLKYQNFDSTDFLFIGSGDITVDHLELERGGIDTGDYKLIHTGDFGSSSSFAGGYVNGTILRRFTQTGSYTFRVALGWMYCPIINLTSITTIPTEISVKAVFQPMPGLDPARSLDRHWVIEKNGEAAGTIRLLWHDDFVRGTDATYKIWRSTGGAPAVVPHNQVDSVNNSIITSGSESVMTGTWGVGEREALTSISLSGSVLTSAGAGIRNATVTISGGNLPQPIVVQTGQFGTYVFDGLPPGVTYNINVSAKRFRFAGPNLIVTPSDSIGNINFTANPPEEFKR